MSLLDILKKEKLSAMKAKDTVRRDILSLVIGQAQQQNVSDDAALHGIIKKLIKSNDETYESARDDMRDQLKEENNILQFFLPKEMSRDEIIKFIDDNVDIASAQSDGQAIGQVMKAIKNQSTPVNGNLVKEIVNEKRNK